MKRQKTLILIGIVLITFLSAALVMLLKAPPEEDGDKKKSDEIFYLLEHDIDEVSYISVENENGFYDVRQQEGGFMVHDIPAELVNAEYLQLLLDETSRIAVQEKAADQPENLSIYGLDQPRATVAVEYTDGTSATLLIGQEEPLSDGVYVQLSGEKAVYLMPRSYTIRFTMPVENFIQYEITPTRKLDSPLAVVRDVTFGGSALPEPIVIQWVDEKNKAQMREAASFGVATHLIRSPGFHELDQAAAAEVFQSMLGIVSEGIIAYNCDEKTIAAYGFNNPYLTADFTIVNGQDAKPEEYHLKIAKQEDGSLFLTCNDNGVIYKILDVAFTKVCYEKFVMRWFLTPFITDLEKMTVTTPDSKMEFELTGDSNKDLAASLNGKQLDMENFRSYFRLVTSACNDGNPRTKGRPKEGPVFTVSYDYKDPEKPDDVMRLYPYNDRTVLVEVNGILEFTMKNAYLERVLQAEQSLKEGTAIEENW